MLATADPAAEPAGGGLRVVDDGDQLEVGLAERNDPVRGAEAVIASTCDGREPEALLDLLRRSLEVVDRDQDVVELHR
jgi:hypothetical protein